MRDYVPRHEGKKIGWLGNLVKWMNANGTAHGFTNAEVNDFAAVAAQAPVEIKKCLAAQDAARAATADKKDALHKAVQQARQVAQRLQRYPGVSNADRAAAGITVPDTTPTPTDPEDILAIVPPMIALDFSIRQQVTIHWGPGPRNEQRNGRPAGTCGCQIQIACGGFPEKETDWEILELSTRSPYIHIVKESTPTTIAYRARYLGKTLQFGAFGAPASCTVSV
ncbi:MAG: hypothetical protein KAH23_03195 [Kiritimatiellae bacterium]|nr:hypothetical protein [Kiritimatiellia bacterium]